MLSTTIVFLVDPITGIGNQMSVEYQDLQMFGLKLCKYNNFELENMDHDS